MELRDSVLALVISFAVTVLIMPRLIVWLHRLKFGQQVRLDGPEAHLKKQGTPTMGGIGFLAGILAASLVFGVRYPRILAVLLLTFGFGLVGFLDDYLKVAKKQSEGLNPKQKFLGQLVLTGLFAAWIVLEGGADAGMRIPFTGIVLRFPLWLYVPALFFIVLGTDNGTNFTDGVDGLASSVTVVTALFFLTASVKYGAGIGPAAGAMAGGLMGFLVFNAYPAKVFMGDTGSLALGGFVAGAAYLCGIPVHIAVVGIIYLAEVLSVILQVGYFKATHGKRIFRMAPIHHHFEKGGWSETRVVTVFTIVTVLACMIAALDL